MANAEDMNTINVCGRHYVQFAKRESCDICLLEAHAEHVRELVEAARKVESLPDMKHEDAGMDCGNSCDVYEDGYQAGLREAAAAIRQAIAHFTEEEK